MIKAILFDLDQTLIDWVKMKTTSLREAVDGMIDAGLDMDQKVAFDKIWNIMKRQHMEGRDPFQIFLEEETGKIDHKILAYGINAYRRVKNGFLSAYPGTKRTLISIKRKGYKLAILTDAPKLKAWLRLSAMRIDDFFDFVVTFDDTGERKPHALPFTKALEKLEVQPEECLMVGDNPGRDIRGAKALGMKTCLAKYGQVYEDDVVPDYTIQSITDLEKLLPNRNN